MDLGLTGRVALVAAGSSGLGLAAASALAAEGAVVSICGRDPERLAAALTTLRAVAGDPGQVSGTVLDVRDEAAVADWVARTAAAHGRLDVVVTNAGSTPSGQASDADLDGYRDALELTVLTAVGLVLAALPHLRRNGWGRVLLITSQSVKQPIPGLALSNVTRPGLAGFAKSLVQELGDCGVTVNVLAPGMTRTPALEEWAAELPDGLPGLAADIPLGRVAEPEEFGAVTAFLASDRASFVTGAVIPVDGGASQGLL